MEQQTLEASRKIRAEKIQSICAEYGLYGNVVHYTPSPFPDSSLNRFYILAGLDPGIAQDPLPKHLRPDEILQNIHRNKKLFHPRIWAMDLSGAKDEASVMDSLVEYCKKAEFIVRLYREYKLNAPDSLLDPEVYQLINYRNRAYSPFTSPAMKQKCREDLDWFFRREKSTSSFRQRWLRYFRSEKFPHDKGPLAKLMGYFRRDQSELSLTQLMDTGTDICKLEMQEHEYQRFRELIQLRYPFVSFAAGKKEVVDHGINKSAGRIAPSFEKCVSGEEYAMIRKDRFSDEGWDCVANLKPSYWIFRDVYYKSCDAPWIASIYQQIVLEYARCDPLGDLKTRGPLLLERVPAGDFMNFVSLAKANHLHFYIDTLGEYEQLSFNVVNVLYNAYQKEKMLGIQQRMIEDKIMCSHVLEPSVRQPLHSIICEIKEREHPEHIHMQRKKPPFQK